MNKKIKRIFALLLISATILMSGCDCSGALEEVFGMEVPDFSLIEEYKPTKQENIAVYANNMPNYLITQNGVIDVYSKVKEKTGGEVSYLNTSYQKDGIYCFFTSEKFNLNVGVLSYDGESFNFKLQTNDLPASFSYHGATESYSALSYYASNTLKVIIIPLADPKNYIISIGEMQGENLRGIYQGGNGEFIIETSVQKTVENSSSSDEILMNNLYLLNTKTLASTTFSFEKNGRIYVGAGNNLAVVCAEVKNSWYVIKDGENYKQVNFSKELNNAINNAKFKKIIGDYFVIGNPCEKDCVVFSFESGNVIEEGSLKEKVKDLASFKKGNMFVVNYNKYKKSFIFEKGDGTLKSEIAIFGENSQPVPEVLKTIAVAEEGKKQAGITEINTYENTGKDIFSCCYFDKKGNKIHCIFSFSFEDDKIDYLGVCGEGVGLINLPGTSGIGITVYN